MLIQTNLSSLRLEPTGENSDENPYTLTSRPRAIKFNRSNSIRMSQWVHRPQSPPVRLSIFGKPLSSHSNKPTTFQMQRIYVYNFLQRPSGIIAISCHSIVAFFIIISLMFYAFTSVPDIEWWSIICLRVFDYLTLSILTVEFVLLCWASSCISKYRGFLGSIRFVCSPFRLLDLLVIAISAVICWTHWFPPSQYYLIWLRCGQVVQILQLENRFQSWRLFSAMMIQQRQNLLIIGYMCLFMMILMAFVVYYCEKDEPDTGFTNLANAVYWSIITVCSIGYGDISPTTTAGRIICAIFGMLGMILYQVPAGIIATGLALKIQEKNRHKHLSQKRVPAAWLIQCTWRFYAASVDSISEVTWKQTLLQIANQSSSSKLKNKNLLNSRLDIDSNLNQEIKDRIVFSQNDEYKLICINQNQVQLTPVLKNCIRFIRAVNFNVAKRKLRDAFRPYDIKDVMQQYSEGHLDVVGRVKHIQTRIHNLELCTETMTHFMKVSQTVHKMDHLEASLQLLNRRIKSKYGENNETSEHNQYYQPKEPTPSPKLSDESALHAQTPSTDYKLQQNTSDSSQLENQFIWPLIEKDIESRRSRKKQNSDSVSTNIISINQTANRIAENPNNFQESRF